MESNLYSKMQDQGLPVSAGSLPGVITYNMKEDEQFEKIEASDGGPGSGNFGHKGRPGKVGGSGSGGGKQYRGGRADIGYFSSRKDWLNGLSGEKQAEASKFIKTAKQKVDELVEDGKKYKEKLDIMVKNGYMTEEDAKGAYERSAYSKVHEGMTPEEYVMKSHPMPEDKKKLVDMVGEARSWNDRGMRLACENLTPEENMALTRIAWKYNDDHPGAITDEELLHNNLDNVFNDLDDEQKQFYLDIKAKACGIPNSGKDISEYSDEFQVSIGAKEPTSNPEDWYNWMDSDGLSLVIKNHNLPVNLLYAAGKPVSSGNMPKTNAERQELWKNVIDEVKNNDDMSASKIQAAARVAAYMSLPKVNDWNKKVKEANETYSPDGTGTTLPNLNAEETQRFLQLLSMAKEKYGDSDLTWNDADRLEQAAIDELYPTHLREYILLKNKAFGGPEPLSEEEYGQKEAKKQEEIKAKQKAFADNIKDYYQKVIRTNDTAEVGKLMDESGIFKQGGRTYLSRTNWRNAVDIANSYGRVIKRYPFLYGTLGSLDEGENRKNVYACCDMYHDGGVSVNASSNRFGDYTELARSYADDVKTGYHPQGTYSDAIVTHELGHSLDGFLSKKNILGSVDSGGDTAAFSGILRRRVLKHLKMTKSMVEKELSKYATKNAYEWFAEAFAEAIHSPDPRPMAKEMIRQLDEILRQEGLLDG